ncbi:hypothetical protein COL5a_000277 [Colletotrichum fioriniae]|uniref:uncharacterized protein n=1 Tax=Colletotrichum fioriniae TaxID=710243 RepID=UPI00230076E9|nr:uncharacterized protein COL516b_004035 [Colletotrichum fioriniae]KAJ0307421.1 hypothetical protein COL516b_004035 [Colletotrichum fioriniae]KAJ0334229.1 hypothetical protein COL5a_000277 [Colletotrichum fioriniae]KAJ3946878.1 hypothetical protein N0V96_003254 [Colletotrichum fioriniae]
MEVDKIEAINAAVPSGVPIPTGPTKDRQFTKFNTFKYYRKSTKPSDAVYISRREKKESFRHLRRNAISGPSTGPRPGSGTDWYDVPSSMLTAGDKLLIATNRLPTIVHIVFKTGFSFTPLDFMTKEAAIDVCRYLELEGKLSNFQGEGGRIADFMRMILNECERFKYQYTDKNLFKEMPKQRGFMPGFWVNIAHEVSIKQTIAKGKPAETWADDIIKTTTCEEMLKAFVRARKAYLQEMAKEGESDANGEDGGAVSGFSVFEDTYTKKMVGLIRAIDNWIAFSEENVEKREAKELALAIDRFQM